VLIADSSRVTQRIAAGLLAARGYLADTTGTGAGLHSAIQERNFDILLVELELPDFSGWEAIEVLRRSESSSEKRIRIIALCSHEDDQMRQRCLDAGSDEILLKPFQAGEFLQAVEGALPQAEDSDDAEPTAVRTLDWDAAVEQLQGREDMLLDLAETFGPECVTLMQQIRSAIDNQDASLLRRAAHTLKGAVNIFCAQPSSEAARRLEFMGRDEDLTEADAAWPALEQEITQLMSAIKQRLANGS
jgi:CheY-like chemotaxis protein/HPt (histidine-containing phosphotransfer) domain-containing protein